MNIIRLRRRNVKIFIIALLLLLIFLYLVSKSTHKKYGPRNVQEFEIVDGTKRPDYDSFTSENSDDPFRSMAIKEQKIFNKINGRYCKEKRNYVFIKTMKCATQTMVHILRRFGYRRHLNFVLPRKLNIYLGWPYILEQIDYRPSKKPFNALVEHSVYNETVFKKLMPLNTQYFTIIREPFAQFKSGFNYFNVANISLVPGNSPTEKIKEYLRNIQKYEDYYKTPLAAPTRYCIPDGFSVTKNVLSHCLGMPLGFPPGRENITSDSTKVQDYLQLVDKNFALVMLMEYFHESLLLLKRIMCWTLEDILYHTINVGSYEYKAKKPDVEDLNIYKSWSHIDFLLYDQFNKTFWQKVEKEGPKFFAEVEEYNTIQKRVSEFCSNLNEGSHILTIKPTEFHDKIVVDKDYCLMMGVDLLSFLKTRFENEESWEDDGAVAAGPKRGC